MHDEDKADSVADAASAAIQSDDRPVDIHDDSTPPPLQPFSRVSPPSSRGAFHPDVPARTPSIPGMPAKPNNDTSNAVVIEPQHLLMGRDINLKGGEITSCKRLTLDGQVEGAILKGAQILEVSPKGTFKGTAEVDEAVIAGRFEGELTARKRLVVRETGAINGKVCYGSIVIEPGGQISGEMQSFNDAS